MALQVSWCEGNVFYYTSDHHTLSPYYPVVNKIQNNAIVASALPVKRPPPFHKATGQPYSSHAWREGRREDKIMGPCEA